MAEDNTISLPSTSTGTFTIAPKKRSKRGIIYLSTIPPYMNVTRIKEYFQQFGKVGRVYLELFRKDVKSQDKKKKKRKAARTFTEGWVEFEKKVVAKRVAALINNTQVSTQKKSKHYDCIWNIKYLSGFKWPHLNERLSYERAARNKKLKIETQLAKSKSNIFSSNVEKKKKKVQTVNREFEDIDKLSAPVPKNVDKKSAKRKWSELI